MINYKVNKITLKDNRHLRYLVFGKGDKTMVILPGLSITYVTDAAQMVVSSFEKDIGGYTVYLLDVPDELPSTYSISLLAKDIHEALETLKLKNIYLYGASMGGMASMYITGEYDDLIKKLVICSSVYKLDDASKILLKIGIT